MNYQPTPKQWFALIIGLLIWAISDWKSDLVFDDKVWYAFEFSFPLAIGIALGWLNESGSWRRLLLLAFLLSFANLFYQVLVFKSLVPSDLVFVAGFGFDCFFASFILNQSRLVATLSAENRALRTSQPGSTTAAPASVGFDLRLESLNKTLPLITTFLLAVGSLLTAFSGPIHRK